MGSQAVAKTPPQVYLGGVFVLVLHRARLPDNTALVLAHGICHPRLPDCGTGQEPPDAAPAGTAWFGQRLAEICQGYKSSFVLPGTREHRWFRYNPDLGAEPLAPCSTVKNFNSLSGSIPATCRFRLAP